MRLDFRAAHRAAARAAATSALVTLALLGHAQPTTLDLTRGGLYLSHVSRGLEGATSYRQVARFVQTDGATTRTTVETFERAASGELAHVHAADLVDSGRFDLVGRDLVYGRTGDAPPECHVLPDGALAPDLFTPMVTGVGDATGSLTATLVATGSEANGLATDVYRIEPPPGSPFDAFEGQVWLMPDTQVIVRYRVTATRRDTRMEWAYDLEALGAVAAPTLPEACAP